MTDKQICRYTALVARKAEIYRELSELRPLVEQEHQKRKEEQGCTNNL